MERFSLGLESHSPEALELAKFKGPHVAVDVALLTVVPGDTKQEYQLAFLVHKRRDGLAKGEWALPGRMVRENERLEDAVEIALEDKCGIKGVKPIQLYTFDNPTRDARGWVMSVAYLAVERENVVNDALEKNKTLDLGYFRAGPGIKLVLPNGQEELPFEQRAIVEKSVEELRRRYKSRPDPDRLLDRTFTLHQLRKIHEAIAGSEIDKDRFRRRMERLLDPLDSVSSGSVGKPAQLFKRKARS